MPSIDYLNKIFKDMHTEYNLSWGKVDGGFLYIRDTVCGLMKYGKPAGNVGNLMDLFRDLMVQEVFVTIDDSGNVLCIMREEVDKLGKYTQQAILENIDTVVSDQDLINGDHDAKVLYGLLHVSFVNASQGSKSPVYFALEGGGFHASVEGEVDCNNSIIISNSIISKIHEQIRDTFPAVDLEKERDQRYVVVRICVTERFGTVHGFLFVYNRNHKQYNGNLSASDALKSFLVYADAFIIADLDKHNVKYDDTLTSYLSEVISDDNYYIMLHDAKAGQADEAPDSEVEVNKDNAKLTHKTDVNPLMNAAYQGSYDKVEDWHEGLEKY